MFFYSSFISFYFCCYFAYRQQMATNNYFFPLGQKFKKYCESNQHQICICMCTSINRLWYFYLAHKKYWYHKNYCSVPKHCCLKPQLASATPYYRQTRMKIRLYSFKYVIGLRHQLKTTQSNVSFWHCFKHC